MNRLLLIDDDSSFLDSLTDLLELVLGTCEYEFDLALSLAEGKEKLKENKYCLILLDISFSETKEGDYGGIILLDYIKSSMSTPVILMTQHNSVEYVFDGAKIGADGFYSKSASPSDKLIPLILFLLKKNSQKIDLKYTIFTDNKYIFVIMPFSENNIDTYDTVKRTVKKVNQQYKVERIDEKKGSFVITDEILHSIQKAAVIICDLTEERQNVYYELGYAKGLDKPVICIARQGTKLHFDIYGFKTIFFNNYRELEAQLSNEIIAINQAEG
jgi:DNA-binding response OmpR family regulator